MFRTKRCLLGTVRQSDYEDIKALYRNEEVRQFLGGTRDQNAIREIVADMSESGAEAWYFSVRELETRKFMGMVSLDLHHAGEGMEVSYQFLPECWGKGYAAEAVGRVILFAFEDLKLPGIVAETQTANMSSCRLLEKLGMRWIDSYERFGAQQSLYAIESDRFFERPLNHGVYFVNLRWECCRNETKGFRTGNISHESNGR